MKPILLAMALLLPVGASAQPFSPAQRAEIEKIIADVLKRDPSILREALAALEAAEARAQADAARSAMSAHAEALARNPADPVAGNPQGALTIVEFSDYRCGFCRRAHPELRRLLAEDRDVRLVTKELPILGPASLVMARVALAAHRQGKWEAVNARLINLQGEPSEANAIAAAVAAGADEARLRRDMNDPAIAAQLQNNLQLARAIGVSGTPAFVIGGRLIPGAMDLAEFRRVVAEARALPR
jgi:protein-disulfide isomerase